MKINGFNFDKYNPVVLEHIERHFVGSDVPGSLFLPRAFKDAKAVVNFAYNHILDYDGKKIIREVNCGKIIGLDALVERAKIPEHFGVQRKMRETSNRGKKYMGDRAISYSTQIVEGMELIPTEILTVVAGPFPDCKKHGFISIYPGRSAPNFSDKRFWREHVLIEKGKIPKKYR